MDERVSDVRIISGANEGTYQFWFRRYVDDVIQHLDADGVWQDSPLGVGAPPPTFVIPDSAMKLMWMRPEFREFVTMACDGFDWNKGLREVCCG